MTDTRSSMTQVSSVSEPSSERARKIDGGAWAVFFIWIGIVMLVGVPWAWFLIGVGAVLLATQVMRQLWSLKVEAFGLAIGVVLVAAGAWDLLSIPLPLMPMVLIFLGSYLLWKSLSPR